MSADTISQLLLDNQTLSFIAVPNPTDDELVAAGCVSTSQDGKIELKCPTAKEWARHLGYCEELPEQDPYQEKTKLLQTFHYEDSLNAILDNLRREENRSLEETGSPILYLAIGFLEWAESKDSEKRFFAPLYTLPITLKKSSVGFGHHHLYTISLNENGITANITLAEKLKQDFELYLPEDKNADEKIKPSSYFQLIEEHILNKQPKWTIRKQAVISLLNFTKQAMYLDLDPKRWADTKPLEKNPILKQIFTRLGNSNEKIVSIEKNEYNIDKLENIHTQFPLVLDADSSQHSALIDAVSGKNLIIQGPPGSGKSQTITNLIAAALNNGKKVLFVAEKMAALNVVKERLEQVGLGDFCLELHSTKMNKAQIAKDLLNKYEKHNTYPNVNITTISQRYENAKNQLSNYAEIINTTWKESGYTIHQILNKAINLQKLLAISPNTIAYQGELIFVQNTIEQIKDDAKSLSGIYSQIAQYAPESKIQNHYWYGVCKNTFDEDEEKLLFKTLSDWNKGLETEFELANKLKNLLTQQNIQWDIENEIDFVQEDVPELANNVNFEQALQLNTKEHQENLEKSISAYQIFIQKIDGLNKVFNEESLENLPFSHNISNTITHLHNLVNEPAKISIEKLAIQKDNLGELIQSFKELRELFNQYHQHLPTVLQTDGLFSESNLNELHKTIGFLEMLPNHLYDLRSSQFQNDLELDRLLSQLSGWKKELDNLELTLKDHFILDNLPGISELQHISNVVQQYQHRVFKFLSTDWRKAKNNVLRIAKTSNPDFSLLSQLSKYRVKLELFNSAVSKHPLIAQFNQGIESDIDALFTLNEWYKTIQNEYGIGFGKRSAIGKALFELDKNTAFALKAEYQRFSQLHEHCKKKWQELTDLFSEYKKIFDKKFLDLESSASYLYKDLDNHLGILENYLNNGKMTLNELKQSFKNLSQSEKALEEYQSYSGLLPFKFNLPNEEQFQSAEETLKFAKKIYKHSLLNRAMLSKIDSLQYLKIKEYLEQIVIQQQNNQPLFNQFEQAGDIEPTQWLHNANLGQLIKRNNSALTHSEYLSNWIDVLTFRQKFVDNGFGLMIEQIDNGAIPISQLQNAVELVMFQTLSRQIMKENPLISKFKGLNQNEIIKQFQEYDRKLMEVQRKQIAHNAAKTTIQNGNNQGLVSTFTELSLIKREAEKSKKHISIRNLIDRAADTVLALKPCFMMSPLSVAQNLKPGIEFDLLVMDEASQILPEDAVGAIARAKNIVIVGDPKQLPPTSFFQKSYTNNDDEVLALQESESILEAFSASYPTRSLKWHYRSRHESLIAFSNKHFYDNKLILFPSPHQETSEFGIRFHKLNGCFIDRKNSVEAEKIVADVVHLIKQGNESLGIVAMNSEQRDEIERHLEDYKKDDPLFRELFDDTEDRHRLFIKNLENVQGDERDVILISMTYGAERENGKVPQRFGPINSESGHRRLNVLFTRAKKRMQIYSSISSGDILPTAQSNKGVTALKAFLEYCETGHLHQTQITGKQPGSDFEIAVIRELEKYGYECEPQLGVAGFYLDLAVKNPYRPGQYLLAIECDGATYHSAKSARDRDRLRQEILEGLGWEIQRIWSTDWFRNPTITLSPILSRLDELKSLYQPKGSQEVESEVANTNEHSVSQEDSSDEHHHTSNIKQPIQRDLFDDEPTSENKTIKPAEKPADSLEDALLKIAERIEQQFPHTPKHQRLLRPEMLHYFLTEMPVNREEFNHVIPYSLRDYTQRNEAIFLNEIFETIIEYQ